MADQVRSIEVLRGHGEDTLVTTEWSAAAGLPTPVSCYKFMASVGLLPPQPLRITIISYEADVSGLLRKSKTDWWQRYWIC